MQDNDELANEENSNVGPQHSNSRHSIKHPGVSK